MKMHLVKNSEQLLTHILIDLLTRINELITIDNKN